MSNDSQKRFMRRARSIPLELEPLESRILLSANLMFNSDGTDFGAVAQGASAVGHSSAILSPTDLVAQFGAITVPNPAIPGDRGNVSVVVTNQGQVRANGSMTINLYASTDQSVGGDIYLGHLTNQLVNLGFGQSKTYTFSNVQLPLSLTAGSYYLRADINATQSVPEGNYADDTVFTIAPLPVVYEFGAVGARKGVILNLTDADGTLAGFMLTGPGTGAVTAGADGWDLDVSGSTTATNVIITTRKSTTPGADAQISLCDVAVAGPLALFSGMGVNLTGSMTVNGKLPMLMLNNLSGDGGITFGGAATDRTTLMFNQVQDESLVTGSTIGLLSAACWEDTDGDGTDSITAPGLTTGIIRKGNLAPALDIGVGGITTLMVTGGSVSGGITDAGALTTLIVNGGSITGNISATRAGMVMVTGGDVSGDITSTATAAQLGALTGIGTLMVNGGDLSGDVTSNGNVSTISATRNALTRHGGNASGLFNLGGGLLSLTLTGGDFSGALNVGGKLGSLSLNKALLSGGNVLAGASLSAGAIGSLRASGAFLGASGNGITVNAGAITSLNVAVDMLYTALSLSNPARNMLLPALGTLSVGGWMYHSRLMSGGNITSVTVGGMVVDSVVFAGVSNLTDANGDGVWDPPSALSDFSSSHAGIGTFTLRGLQTGATPSAAFINSNIAGWKVGTVTLREVQTATPGSSQPFGLAAGSIKSYIRRQGTTVACTWPKPGAQVWPQDDHDDFVVRTFAPEGVWSVHRNADILEIAYGQGTNFPQYAALDLDSSYLRMIDGPDSGWGTSVILLPSFWAGGQYYQGSPVSASWTTGAGSLILSISGTIGGLQCIESVTFDRPNPAQGQLTASVAATVSGHVNLTPKPGEAFKPVMLSSMHISATQWDAQNAFVAGQTYLLPAGGWIVAPPAQGTVFGLTGGTSLWKTNAPTTEVSWQGSPMQVTGWITSTNDPNADNVGFWTASDQVLSSWSYVVMAKR